MTVCEPSSLNSAPKGNFRLQISALFELSRSPLSLVHLLAIIWGFVGFFCEKFVAFLGYGEKTL